MALPENHRYIVQVSTCIISAYFFKLWIGKEYLGWLKYTTNLFTSIANHKLLLAVSATFLSKIIDR